MNMREAAFTLLARPAPMRLAGLQVLVLGLGDTGLSVAQWVRRQGGQVRVADTRAAPPRASDLVGAALHAGPFDAALLEGIDLVCISPGLALEQPLVDAARSRGIPVLGDIELFAWHLRGAAPAASADATRCIAITGTNGKTTVSALTGHLLRAAGLDCEVAGNIGPAALAALAAREDAGRMPQAWVLELSSYQLETTWSLAPDAAVLLNVSDDHLDRYPGIAAYAAAKARIYAGAGVRVFNRADPRSRAAAAGAERALSFGLDVPPHAADLGVRMHEDTAWLAEGETMFLRADTLRIHGGHNLANALAAAALARRCGAGLPAIAEGLRSFEGLPHRLQRVSLRAGVAWYDDSKGTNVGATIAALEGLCRPGIGIAVPGRLILIAGGDGKGQDFAPLAAAAARHADHVLLVGRDAPQIEAALGSTVSSEHCASLEAAVAIAARRAAPGDAVLLSPACASFDMFRDYRHRGQVFAQAVHALGAA